MEGRGIDEGKERVHEGEKDSEAGGEERKEERKEGKGRTERQTRK